MTDDAEGCLERARQWIAGDPDPETRAELQALIDAGQTDLVAERMDGELEFGTAGLRGRLGAGSARMNRAVVIRCTRGVADTLLRTQPDARVLPVVVGYDARRYARELAETAAGVLVAAGLPVRYFPRAVPTPLVAYAAAQLSACAAIVLTASHNPSEWGGYKLYDETAAQIAPPADERVAAAISRVGAATEVPCAAGVFDRLHPRAEPVPDSLFDRYLSQLDAIRPVGPADRELRIAYTPLHGVGLEYVERAFAHAGYPALHVVAAQAEPDPDFPTAPLPNPEEPAALELGIKLAAEVKADLLLANDPDADRLAVSVPTVSGRFVRLSGNQVGLLLADFLLRHATRPPRPLIVSTVVSSPMLESIAEHHGARFEATLTGFKWILRAAWAIERSEQTRFLFGFEEAIGYTAGSVVRDKDGVGAAVLFADLAASCRARGETVQERLWELYRKHGLWASAARAVWAEGRDAAARIQASFARLVEHPPTELGGRRVVSIEDYSQGGELRPAWLPSAPLLQMRLDAGGRVSVRPSGTEPKLKIYVDLRFPIEAGESMSQKEEQARVACEAVADQVIRYIGVE